MNERKKEATMFKRRIMQVMIVCVMLVSTVSTSYAQLFTDVPDNHKNKAEFDYLAAWGAIDANQGTMYRLHDAITRYEAAELLVRAMRADTENRPIPMYTDIATDDPRMPVIATITELQVMTGTDGKFNPDAKLTRAQAAGILIRAFGLQGSTTSTFPDVDAAHWATPAIHTLIANQITTGFEDGTYRPSQSLTRSNFAIFVARVLNPAFRLAKNEVPVVKPTPTPQEPASCERETNKKTYKVDVAVANMWKNYNAARQVDAPSTTNPVQMDKWINSMTLSQKKWLVDRTDTQALYNDEVTILESRGNWYRIAANDQYVPYQKEGYPGWVPKSQITATTKNYDDCAIAVISSKKANLYEADYKKVHVTVSYATILPIIKEAGNYYFVQTPDAGVKLLKKIDAKKHESYEAIPKPSAKTIIDEAKRYLNLPYLWAGTSSWGYDCSGILYAIFKAHGIMIPRDSFYQATKGTAVTKNNLKAGDLVFFAYNGGKGKVYHVGLYLGNGQMLHAPHYASKVRIEPLNQGVYQKNYAGARRYL
ncbi:hydrolase [Caryophanon tenue]|uniref:Hydrolase n=2 Tax=Caryophanon tenue TaxID=33978 RepID=A0A1C0YDH7_9BACL|nr:hydrolase [Caryophanon tenue]